MAACRAGLCASRLAELCTALRTSTGQVLHGARRRHCAARPAACRARRRPRRAAALNPLSVRVCPNLSESLDV